MSKKVFAWVLVFCLVISLAACSGNSAAPSEPSSSAGSSGGNASTGDSDPAGEPPADSSKQMTLLTYLDPNGTDVRGMTTKKMIDQFKEETGYEIIAEVVGWEEIEQRVLMSMASDQAPDITFVRSQSTQVEVQSGALLPLDDYVARDWTNGEIDDIMLWDSFGVVDGKKYAIPMAVYVQCMYYRTDILEEHGIASLPKTWDEWLELGQTVSGGELFGYVFCADSSQPSALDYIQPYVESFGGKILDDEGKAAFNTPEAAKAFQMLKDAVFVYGMTPPDVISLSYAEANDMYAAGMSVIHCDGSHKFTKYIDGVGIENIEIGPIPTPDGSDGPTLSSGWALGIPTKSPNPDMAWEFIKLFFSEENAAMYAKEANEVAVRLSIYEEEFFQTDPVGQKLSWWADYADRKASTPVGPLTFNQLSEICSVAVQRCLESESSNVQQILDDAVAEYNALA